MSSYDETRISLIRYRLNRLDDGPGRDYLVLLNQLLEHDLPYLLNLVEELKGEKK